MKEDENLTRDIVAIENNIKQRIFIIRGVKVMVDKDLAELYRISTKSLNKAVGRNMPRFPSDFMFQLNKQEYQNLRFQIGTSSSVHGGSRYLPYVFTEHGVAMLSSVLKSDTAVQMNILIIRVFIKVQHMLVTNKDLAIRIGEIEKKQREQGDLLSTMHSVVRQLIEKPLRPKEEMGFKEKK